MVRNKDKAKTPSHILMIQFFSWSSSLHHSQFLPLENGTEGVTVDSSPWAAAPARILLWCEVFTDGGLFRISPPSTVWGFQWAALWIPDPLWSSTATPVCSSALPPLHLLFLTCFSSSLLVKLLCSIFCPFLTAFPKMSLFSCGTQLCPAVSLAHSSPKPPHRSHPWVLSCPLTTKMWTCEPNTHF